MICISYDIVLFKIKQQLIFLGTLLHPINYQDFVAVYVICIFTQHVVVVVFVVCDTIFIKNKNSISLSKNYVKKFEKSTMCE